MAPSFSDIVEEARLSARALWDYGDSFFNPTVRLGVTGLSRAGKTVFITALVHDLIRGGRLPVFEALRDRAHRRAPGWSRSRTTRCRASTTRTMSRALVERAALAELDAPTSASCASSIDYERARTAREPHGSRSTSSTIPANGCSTCRCSTRATRNGRRESARTVARRRRARHSPRAWHAASGDARRRRAASDEQAARRRPKLFTDYLRACRDERFAIDLLPPGPLPDAGRPRRLAGADLRAARRRGRRHRARRLAVGDDGAALRGLQGRRGAAVLPRSLRPARPADRAGRRARRAQCRAGGGRRSRSARSTDILDCFRIGRGTLAHRPVPPAHRPHPVRRHQGRPSAPHQPRPAGGDPAPRWSRRAAERADFAGAEVDVVALAAVRATREAHGAARPARSCRPSSARRARARALDGETFDGETEVALFPGDLPDDPERTVQGAAFAASPARRSDKADFRFLRFRPPRLERDGDGRARAAAHPPRPRAPVPDRRPPAMSEKTPHARPARSGSTIPAWS